MQIYGVPTVRHDIKAPRKQSIANSQNYGNEPNSRQLIHPAAMVERGVHEQHFLQQMSKDTIRQVIQPIELSNNINIIDTDELRAILALRMTMPVKLQL